MLNLNKIKRQKRARRKIRIRAKIIGTAQKPRLSVFRSNKHIFLQLIDDEKRKTLVSMSDILPKAPRPTPARLRRDEVLAGGSPLAKSKAGGGKKSKTKITKTKLAFQIGRGLAELAKKKKIIKVIFDRGGYAYHGRIKAAAEGAREGGLKF